MSQKSISIKTKGRIISVPTIDSGLSPVVIRVFESNYQYFDVTINRIDFNRVFRIDRLDKSGELLYNNSEDVVTKNDAIDITFIGLPGDNPPIVSKEVDISKELIPHYKLDDFIDITKDYEIDEFTFKIGTSILSIPPSVINVERINTSKSVASLRSKGTIRKNEGRSDTRITLEIFFNGINQLNDPDNGLRAIVAQFKKTPFVPIRNRHLNFDHGIEAVCLHNVRIETVKDFPELILCTLTLFKFDYTVFMPTADSFMINQRIFKWHYKRHLINNGSEEPLLKEITSGRTSKLKFNHVPDDEIREAMQNKRYSDKVFSAHAMTTSNEFYQTAKKDANIIRRMKETLEYIESSPPKDIYGKDTPVSLEYQDFGYKTIKRKQDNYSYFAFFCDLSNVMNYTFGDADNFFDSHDVSWLQYSPSSAYNTVLIYDPVYKKWLPESAKLINQIENTTIVEAERIIKDASKHLIERDTGLETLFAGKMVPWEGLEDIVIDKIETELINNFARLPVQMTESPTYQFLGSQDGLITLRLKVYSSKSLSSLTRLYEFSNAQARTYRSGLSSGFLELDNELTKLLGIRHVLIDSMIARNEQMFPGVYNVELVLVDFNIFQAYNERGGAIVKEGKDFVLKSSYYNPEEFSTYPGITTSNISNGGSTIEWSRAIDLMKGINVYPDLDLPTYEELNKFLTSIGLPEYPNPTNAIWVDPDFYFVTPRPRNEIFEEVLHQNDEILIKDSTGLTLSVEPTINLEEYIDRVPGAIDFAKFLENTERSTKEIHVMELKTKAIEQIKIATDNANVTRSYSMINNDIFIPYEIAITLGIAESDLTHFDSYGNPIEIAPKVFHNGEFKTPYGIMQIIDEYYARNKYFGINDVSAAHSYNTMEYTSSELRLSPEKNAEVGIRVLMEFYKNVQPYRFIKTISTHMGNNFVNEDLLKVDPKIVRLKELSGNDFPWIAAIFVYKGITPAPKDKTSLEYQDWSTKVKKYVDNIFHAYLEAKYVWMGHSVEGLKQDELDILNMKLQVATEKTKEDILADAEMSHTPTNNLISSRDNGWYDEMYYSKKGRMLRAFPTFHMFVIDEGRWIRWQKMWDNFYGTNALTKITVNKSRKRVADTCMIEMSNAYKNYTDQSDEQFNDDYKHYKMDWSQVFWFKITDEMEASRALQYGNLQILPGCRIHLRIGYGNNLKEIPVMFNGAVTEISVGDYVTMIAQGDGLELTEPLKVSSNKQGSVTSGFMGLGDEPRNILGKLISVGYMEDSDGIGHWWKNVVLPKVSQREERFYTTHFGDPEINAWSTYGGEMLQNIYPGNGVGYPEWQNVWTWKNTGDPVQVQQSKYEKLIGQYIQKHGVDPRKYLPKNERDGASIARMQADPELNEIFNALQDNVAAAVKSQVKDEINLEVILANKCFWDAANILAAVIPNYICAVHPFEFRSTFFYGKPHWNIAYEYEVANNPDPNKDGWAQIGEYFIREKKKPYSQWHIYSSYEDIIKNEIKASSDGVYTNVSATYYGTKPTPWSELPQRSVTAFADQDIYPQNQKTINIDSELISTPPLGPILTLFGIFKDNPIASALAWAKGWIVADSLAFNIAASNVRDYMKDMYKGNLMVIGDPTVKPHDHMYISDIFEEMFGTCGVKEVTHYFDLENGFVTSIKPDVAVTNDDKDQINLWNMSGAIGSAFVARLGISTTIASLTKAAAFTARIGGSVAYGLPAIGSSIAATGGAMSTAATYLSSTGIAALAGVPLLIALPVFILTYATLNKIVSRYFDQAQCVCMNLLQYRGKEFSAGIQGHRGITVALSNAGEGKWERFKGMLPEWLSGEVGGVDPNKIFEGLHGKAWNDQEIAIAQTLSKDKIGFKNQDLLSLELQDELARIMTQYQNDIVNRAIYYAGTPYGEEGMDNFNFIKRVMTDLGYEFQDSDYESLFNNQKYAAITQKSDDAKGSIDLHMKEDAIRLLEQNIKYGIAISKDEAIKHIEYQKRRTYQLPDQALPGDIILFHSESLSRDYSSVLPTHVGVLIDQESFISMKYDREDATHNGSVQITNLYDPNFRYEIYAVLRPIKSLLRTTEVPSYGER